MEALVTREYPNVDLAVYEQIRLHNTKLHFRSADAFGDYRRILDTDLLIGAHREPAFYTGLAVHKSPVATLEQLTLKPNRGGETRVVLLRRAFSIRWRQMLFVKQPKWKSPETLSDNRCFVGRLAARPAISVLNYFGTAFFSKLHRS